MSSSWSVRRVKCFARYWVSKTNGKRRYSNRRKSGWHAFLVAQMCCDIALARRSQPVKVLALFDCQNWEQALVCRHALICNENSEPTTFFWEKVLETNVSRVVLIAYLRPAKTPGWVNYGCQNVAHLIPVGTRQSLQSLLCWGTKTCFTSTYLLTNLTSTPL